MRHWLWILCLGVSVQQVGAEGTRVDQLLAGYRQITNLVCDVRKDSVRPEGEGRMLSRVWFEAPNHLLVENSTPARRRILCDGKTQYFHSEEEQTALKFPFAELPLDMQIQAQSVPASPMEHLLRLKGLEETPLPAMEGYPVRTGYHTDKLFAVLCFDATGRLARLEFYTSPAMTNCYATTDYSLFEEPLAGVWLSLRQDSFITVDGEMKGRESRRFSNLKVNTPLAPGMFDVRKVFSGVEFKEPPR